MQLNIDIKQMDAIIAKAQPQYEKRIAAKPKTKTAQTVGPMLQAKMPVGFVDIPKIEAGLLTFCGAWEKINPILNLGLKYASWFMKASDIGLAKSVLEAINTVFISQVCKPKVPTT